MLETRLTRRFAHGQEHPRHGGRLSEFRAPTGTAACQILVQQPRVGELYEKLLIGERKQISERQG